MFSADELERYQRHLVMHDVGGAGQQKLKRSTVAVVGAGGLGAPVLLYLAAAGVGTLRIIDDDVVARSNLQRQVIYTSDDAQKLLTKVEAAQRAIDALNPNVRVEPRRARLVTGTAVDLLAGADVVVDGSDSFATRDVVASACEALAIPLVTGAVGVFDGSVTVLKPYEKNAAGTLNPRYRDLFPSPPPDGSVPTCEQAGIVGALTGVIGCLQSMEAIKLIADIGEPLVGRLLMYDGRGGLFETIRYQRSE